ncbi:uncharacterized protein LOC123312026 [Coccinella septempunctata]|uniref:uncharacterized protein LOC123312026 n=1 Tax=Coccinella septempunctata TaxID=41139 RepID=UPI001D0974CE|nr:uncharacterized protein LOC123312026 [Coccinella septempunctata]
MDFEENSTSTPPDVANVKRESLSLLPEKSRSLYEKTYSEFIVWCEKKNVTNYTESVMLEYFTNIAKKGLIASLWPKYSMLKATLSVKNNIDISGYNKLIMFFKQQKEGYNPKKSKVLEKEHIKEFITNAPDNMFLMMKVALIFGVAGALRKDELYRLRKNDVQDIGTKFLVTVQSSRSHSNRIFTVVDNDEHTVLVLIRRYISLRLANTPHDKFFVFYRNDKCTVQPVGSNTFAKLPSIIADFLKLEQPLLYTGHCFRRSSASIHSDSGSEFSTIKHLGGRKSTTVAENISRESCMEVSDVNASISSTHSLTNIVGNTINLNLKTESDESGIPSVPSLNFSNCSIGNINIKLSK